MDKFRGKYRIPSARLQTWDYGANGAYFVTICTYGREDYFGDCKNGIMNLNEIGIIAEKYWIEIPNHFPFVELGNFVIMPNHTHGIIIINKITEINGDAANIADIPVQTPKLGVSATDTAAASQKWNPGNLGVIINQYKRKCTIESRKINPNFLWQTRFHDHIIRNSGEFERIQYYIENNPTKWQDDKFNNPIGSTNKGSEEIIINN